MASLDQLLAAVEQDTTLDGSILQLLQQVKNQLDEVLAGTTLPAGVQAKVDEIFNKLSANNEVVAAAVAAHTPAEPPVEPENPSEG